MSSIPLKNSAITESCFWIGNKAYQNISGKMRFIRFSNQTYCYFGQTSSALRSIEPGQQMFCGLCSGYKFVIMSENITFDPVFFRYKGFMKDCPDGKLTLEVSSCQHVMTGGRTLTCPPPQPCIQMKPEIQNSEQVKLVQYFDDQPNFFMFEYAYLSYLQSIKPVCKRKLKIIKILLYS